jgi:hypothetical protein
MSGPTNTGVSKGGGGFCLGLVALIVLLMIFARGDGDRESPSPQSDTRRQSLEELKEKYPRMPANGIRVPPLRDLRNPGFDVGRHCLAEERAGRGSFEDCLEVVGRELIAIGGPEPR